MKLTVLTIFSLFQFMGCAAASKSLPTVSKVEVERYVGKWNAISSLPQIFTNSCIAQTAEYEIESAGVISVLNTCIKKNGKTKTIDGQAKAVDSTNSKLIVTFNNFWTKLFKVKGDYSVLKLDRDYEYVLVGSKDFKSLWIMARDESMPLEIYNEYVAYAKKLGFDTSKLVLSKF